MSNQLQQNNSSGLSRGVQAPSSFLRNIVRQQRFDQLCLLLLDGSGSMTYELEPGVSKADAAAAATAQLLELLKKSSNAASFSLGIICFAEIVETRLYQQYVLNLKEDQLDFTPFPKNATCRYTYIAQALDEAERMAEGFLNSKDAGSPMQRTVRILLVSDGYATDAEKAKESAERIKNKFGDTVRINTTIFGRSEEEEYQLAEQLLKDLASTDEKGQLCYERTPSAAALRAFLERTSSN